MCFSLSERKPTSGPDAIRSYHLFTHMLISEFIPGVFGGVLVAYLFSLLCCPIMYINVLSSVL